MISQEKTFKRFLRTETYSSRSGIVMEKDVYGIYLKEPELDSDGVLVTTDVPLGIVSENERPRGMLFKGKNRKERRIANKKNRARG